MTEMTDATTSSATTSANAPSFWEDLIEIFVHPVDVFRRRANESFWPPMLFVAMAIGVITFATWNVISPVFEAEFTRNMAKQIAENPQAAASMEKMKDTMIGVTRFTLPIGLLVSMLVVGLLTWLVGKLFDSKATLGQGMTIAGWAYMPRVLGSIAGSVQGLLMDPAKLNSAGAISLSPARFMDVDLANPIVYQFLGRLDLMIVWATVLLGFGLYAIGKVTKGSAAAFAVIMWVLGTLPMLRTAYMQM
jgi:hypothetical protein